MCLGNGLDYSSYHNCRRQINTNSPNLVNSKPLCLFNLAALWSPLDNKLSLQNEVFSVQSLLTTKNKSLVYFTSVCRNKIDPETELSFTGPVINLKKLNVEVKNQTTSTTPETSTPVPPVPTTTNKQRQKFQSLMSSVKIFQLNPPNISSCYVLNENELQFKITQLSPALKYSTNKPILVYYLEFNSNDLESLAAHGDQKPTKKFFIKKQNDIQVSQPNIFICTFVQHSVMLLLVYWSSKQVCTCTWRNVH